MYFGKQRQIDSILEITFLNLVDCPYCQNVTSNLAQDINFKTVLLQSLNVQWKTKLIHNEQEKSNFRNYYLTRWNLEILSFPAFAIWKKTLDFKSIPYIISGSENLEQIKDLVRSFTRINLID